MPSIGVGLRACLVVSAAALLAPSARAGDSAYLDRCTLPTDCASDLCIADLGGTNFCTRLCSSDAECAAEHVCAGGQCEPDDTGEPCASGGTCATGLCIGAGLPGSHCTRECVSAADCPAGYSCIDGGGTKVCLEIEIPCSTCLTGMCTGVGCTSSCLAPGDCPVRFDGLPAYTCSSMCIPPADILGDGPIGAACAGDGDCRSAVCNSSGALGSTCTQACNPQGLCDQGFACIPISGTLACDAAGGGDLSTACSGQLDCRSGLCGTDSSCTRLCSDGLCPTGYVCPSGESPLCLPIPIFGDDFESADTCGWSSRVGSGDSCG